jgi:hypothetical protein
MLKYEHYQYFQHINYNFGVTWDAGFSASFGTELLRHCSRMLFYQTGNSNSLRQPLCARTNYAFGHKFRPVPFTLTHNHFGCGGYGMIIIDSNWVSTPWKWSVNLYKNRQETDMYKRRNNTKNNTKHRIHKIENKRSQQEHNHRKIIKKRKSSNYKITNGSK